MRQLLPSNHILTLLHLAVKSDCIGARNSCIAAEVPTVSQWAHTTSTLIKRRTNDLTLDRVLARRAGPCCHAAAGQQAAPAGVHPEAACALKFHCAAMRCDVITSCLA